jgi:hypothetical protein
MPSADPTIFAPDYIEAVSPQPNTVHTLTVNPISLLPPAVIILRNALHIPARSFIPLDNLAMSA